MSKVLERIVKDKLLTYIFANHLQDPNQHGFVSKRSVVSNLLVSDSILTKLLDRNIPVDMILFDFSKAFDRISHSLLLHYLNLLGIGGSFSLGYLIFFLAVFYVFLLEIIHAYLHDIIQGSVLGLALYSIYSSSISNLINHAHYLFYADNLMPLIPITCRTDLQSDLDRSDKWATQWGMSFNKDKCHVLHFRSNSLWGHVYMLGNYSLNSLNSADDLGLLHEATSLGRYDLHIQYAIKKSCVLFLILCGLSSCRVNIMHKVFVSYIRLIIVFAAVLWFPHTVLQHQ